ncbi:MAG TPA: nitrogen fixation protein NifQ [Burkholderiaceae bacterium]|nr:nitrogen fixation protein NifQ [Burkholderiaceae bacterium]
MGTATAPLHPAATSPQTVPWAVSQPARQDEVDEVMALLLEHAAPHLPEVLAQALAQRIALACLGERHLWEDLGLPSRAALGELMQRHFPTLKVLNAAGMRWKKFIYRQLCIKHEVLICRSPSCAVCDEAAVCFGPETAGSA